MSGKRPVAAWQRWLCPRLSARRGRSCFGIKMRMRPVTHDFPAQRLSPSLEVTVIRIRIGTLVWTAFHVAEVPHFHRFRKGIPCCIPLPHEPDGGVRRHAQPFVHRAEDRGHVAGFHRGPLGGSQRRQGVQVRLVESFVHRGFQKVAREAARAARPGNTVPVSCSTPPFLLDRSSLFATIEACQA